MADKKCGCAGRSQKKLRETTEDYWNYWRLGFHTCHNAPEIEQSLQGSRTIGTVGLWVEITLTIL